MKYLQTLPNSFIIGEKDNNGKILEQYGFPKGGLTYLIKGNNIKFYLTEDYFYKNVVYSADAPFLINGVPISVDNLPAALKNIFKIEQEQVDVDTEFDDQSFNPIANAPVAIRFNDVDSTIDSLSGEVQTKADIEDIPTNVSELVNDAGYVTEESISGDYATKQWVEDQGYLTEHQDISGKMDVSGMTAYTTNDAFSTHTGNTDIHVTANEKETWNNKSDFSGDYNDLTNKPTNVSDFTNDAGYVTQTNIDESISGKADTTAVTASLAALDEKKLDASAYTPTDLSNYYTKDETSGATEIATALDGKADIEDIPTNVSELVNDEGYVTQTNIDAAVSGKADTSAVTASITAISEKIDTVSGDVSTHTANTDIHVTASDKQNWNNKSDFSGSYNDLTDKPTIPVVPTNVSDFVNDAGYVTQNDIDAAVSGKADTSDVQNVASDVTTVSGDVNTLSGSVESLTGNVNTISGDVSTLSGKVNTNETILTGHTANTDIHVTASDKQNWNNKSDFSGSYNDLTDKPTIPTVPTNVSDFVNDAGYATTGDVQTATADMATQTWVQNQGYLTEHQSLSNYYTKSETSGATEISTALASKADTATTYTKTEVDTALGGKVNTSTYETYTAATSTAIGNKANSSDVYTKSETSGATEIATALNAKLDTTAYTPTDLSNYYQKSETSGATQISTALDGKANTATTYTKTEVDNAITAATSTKQDTLVSGTNIKTINNESLIGSGNINIQGGGGNNVIELTQAQYDALTDIDPDAFYIITDADGGATSGQVQTMINTAIATKQDTLVSGTNIKTINNESILGSGNIDIQGGGKAIEAGAGISVTTGATADTVSLDVPIRKGKSNTTNSFQMNGDGRDMAEANNSFAGGAYAKAKGDNSFAFGYSTDASGQYSFGFGFFSKANGRYSVAIGKQNTTETESSIALCEGNTTNNKYEFAAGYNNNSVSASTTFGDSGNTLFSVGNGTANNARHNAFEIRQNGDIYITSGGTDIKLQDNLGGGGGGTIDQSVISGSTNAVSGGAVYTQLGGLKLVQLSQSEYDALATKDASTLYIIVN